MIIQRSILRTASLFALMLGLGAAVSAARGTLHLDGILQVRGAAASSARIVVLPTGGMPYAMDNVSGRFTMSLPLDGTYLLSFEREGLVTKQVYFDTSVPVDKHQSELSFPFKVTLFSVGRNDVYTYAGPVGYVHYDAGKQDFDYETDYTLKPGMPMFQRISSLMAQMDDRGDDGLPKAAIITYRATNASAGSLPNVVAVAASPGEVENTMAEELLEERNTAPHEAVADVSERIPVRAEEPVPVAAVPAGVEEGDAGGNTIAKPLVSMVHRPNVQQHKRAATDIPPPVDPLTLPREELIVERNRVITLVRVPEATGHVSEYRRVADRHGMVVHFRDGVQIPEQLYHEGTAR